MNSKDKKRPAWILPILILLLLIIFIRVFIGQPSYIPSESMENTLLRGDYVWVNKLTYGSLMPRRYADIPLINVFTWVTSLREKDRQNDWGYHRVKTGRQPSYGDIAVYTPMDAPSIHVVKRIVGCPGDTIIIEEGELFINGKPAKQISTIIKTQSGDQAQFPAHTKWSSHNYGPLVVPGKKNRIKLDNENYLWIKDMASKEGNVLTCARDSLYFCNGERIDAYSFMNDYYFTLGDNRQNSLDSRFSGFGSEQEIVGTINFVVFSIDTNSNTGINKKRFFKKVH